MYLNDKSFKHYHSDFIKCFVIEYAELSHAMIIRRGDGDANEKNEKDRERFPFLIINFNGILLMLSKKNAETNKLFGGICWWKGAKNIAEQNEIEFGSLESITNKYMSIHLKPCNVLN